MSDTDSLFVRIFFLFFYFILDNLDKGLVLISFDFFLNFVIDKVTELRVVQFVIWMIPSLKQTDLDST